MKNIEVEIRSFISEAQYNKLIDHFKRTAQFAGEDYQETFYFSSEEDLRIQKNSSGGKIWLKKGKIHDDKREEIEVKLSSEEFKNAERLFLALGYEVEIKWYRTRNTFIWEDTTVTVDFTKGYGYIIELEKMSTVKDQDKTLEELREKMQSLDIEITNRDEFDKKLEFYKANWKDLTK